MRTPTRNLKRDRYNHWKGSSMASEGFYQDIVKFNEMYGLESADSPQPLPVERIANFQNILAEEVEEGSDITNAYKAALDNPNGLSEDAKTKLLTDMSDWLGDLIVYCASEARRWGLPLDEILRIIMASNFSKLGADGQPICDERGKVLKGPGYWKPEPKISELLSRYTDR